MKPGAPWSVKGIEPETRETAKSAARRAGMTLGEWLNHVILNSDTTDPLGADLLRDPAAWAEETGTPLPWSGPIDELSASVNQRLVEAEEKSHSQLKALEGAIGAIAERLVQSGETPGGTPEAYDETRLTRLEDGLKNTISKRHLETLETAVGQISVVLDNNAERQNERIDDSTKALEELDRKLGETSERINQALSAVEAAAELYEITDRQGQMIDSLVMDVAAVQAHQNEASLRQNEDSLRHTEDLQDLRNEVSSLRDQMSATEQRLTEAADHPNIQTEEAVAEITAQITAQITANEDRTAGSVQSIEDQIAQLSQVLDKSLTVQDQGLKDLQAAFGDIRQRLENLEEAEARKAAEPQSEPEPEPEPEQEAEPTVSAQPEAKTRQETLPRRRISTPPPITFRALPQEDSRHVTMSLAVQPIEDLVKSKPVELDEPEVSEPLTSEPILAEPLAAEPEPDAAELPEPDLETEAEPDLSAEPDLGIEPEPESETASEAELVSDFAREIDEAISEESPEPVKSEPEEINKAETTEEETSEETVSLDPETETSLELTEEEGEKTVVTEILEATPEEAESPELSLDRGDTGLLDISADDFAEDDEAHDTADELEAADQEEEDEEPFKPDDILAELTEDHHFAITELVGAEEGEASEAIPGKRSRSAEEEAALEEAVSNISTIRASWAGKGEKGIRPSPNSVRQVVDTGEDEASKRGWALTVSGVAAGVLAISTMMLWPNDAENLVAPKDRPSLADQFAGWFDSVRNEDLGDELAIDDDPVIELAETPPPAEAITEPPFTLASFDRGLKDAAQSGNPKAQFALARAYSNGDTVPMDRDEAVKWYRAAADKGLAIAQYVLGSLSERGIDVPEDKAGAIDLYASSARGGNRRSMHNLAVAYARGEFITQDLTKAAYWFTEAANLGLSDAQYNLALLFERGLGVEQNNQTAYKWYGIAAMGGDSAAAKQAERLGGKLDANALNAANRQIDTWQSQQMDPIANGLFDISPAAYNNLERRTSIANVQMKLTELGYAIAARDGVMDPSTQAAIRAFEASRDLEVTGSVSQGLVDTLFAPAE